MSVKALCKEFHANRKTICTVTLFIRPAAPVSVETCRWLCASDRSGPLRCVATPGSFPPQSVGNWAAPVGAIEQTPHASAAPSTLAFFFPALLFQNHKPQGQQ